MKNNCYKAYYKLSYYAELDSHIRNKVVLPSNYATKKELDHAPAVDTSDLTTKNNFIALKG